MARRPKEAGPVPREDTSGRSSAQRLFRSALRSLVGSPSSSASFLVNRLASGPQAQELARELVESRRKAWSTTLGKKVTPSADQARRLEALVQAEVTNQLDALVSDLEKARKLLPDATSAQLLDRLAKRPAVRTQHLFNVASPEVERRLSAAAGSSRYVWVTRLDSRVRAEHKELHNTVHSWDSPVPGEGYPGQAWGCRCRALPLPDPETPQERGPRAFLNRVFGKLRSTFGFESPPKPLL